MGLPLSGGGAGGQKRKGTGQGRGAGHGAEADGVGAGACGPRDPECVMNGASEAGEAEKGFAEEGSRQRALAEGEGFRGHTTYTKGRSQKRVVMSILNRGDGRAGGLAEGTDRDEQRLFMPGTTLLSGHKKKEALSQRRLWAWRGVLAETPGGELGGGQGFREGRTWRGRVGQG